MYEHPKRFNDSAFRAGVWFAFARQALHAMIVLCICTVRLFTVCLQFLLVWQRPHTIHHAYQCISNNNSTCKTKY